MGAKLCKSKNEQPTVQVDEEEPPPYIEPIEDLNMITPIDKGRYEKIKTERRKGKTEKYTEMINGYIEYVNVLIETNREEDFPYKVDLKKHRFISTNNGNSEIRSEEDYHLFNVILQNSFQSSIFTAEIIKKGKHVIKRCQVHRDRSHGHKVWLKCGKCEIGKLKVNRYVVIIDLLENTRKKDYQQESSYDSSIDSSDDYYSDDISTE